MPSYCLPVEIFIVFFLVFIERDDRNLALLAKTAEQRKVS